jgi:hypothetical protein
VSDNPRARATQASSANTSQNIVTDLRSRDQWMIAFNEVSGGFDVSAFNVALEFVIRLGNRIALHHRCKPPHRCDPGYDTLAREMKVSRSTLMRGIAALEAIGWIARKRGGRDDNVSFTLRIGVNMLAPMEAGSYVSKNASIGVTQGDTSNEQRNRVERSALQARASSASGLADTVGPTINQEPVPVLRARGQAALNAYGDDGFIDFGGNPTATVYASSN